jgi:hypothetical protein
MQADTLLASVLAEKSYRGQNPNAFFVQNTFCAFKPKQFFHVSLLMHFGQTRLKHTHFFNTFKASRQMFFLHTF